MVRKGENMALAKVRRGAWHRGLLAFAGVVLLGLIVACGGDDATPTSAAPTATSPAPTATSPVPPTPTPTATPIPAWQVDWDQTLEAAKEEGVVVINVARSVYRQGAEFFLEAFPDINIEAITARGGAMAERLLREKDAGIFTLDVSLSGGTTALTVLRPAGILGDTRAQLIRPDVIDDENWIGTLDDHWCDDDTKKFVFCHWAERSSANAEVNRELLSEEEFNKIEDLFKPELKGKWCLFDPRGRGSGQAFLTEIALVKGSAFVRQLLEETDPVLSTDDRQMSADIIRGDFLFCVTAQIPSFHLEGVGLHVQEIVFPQRSLAPEWVGVRSTCCGTGTGKTAIDGLFSSLIGGPVLINNAPNPNAAKIFMNWIATPDGARDYLRPHLFSNCSARVDMQDVCEKPPLEDGKSFLSNDRVSTLFIRDVVEDIAQETLGGR